MNMERKRILGEGIEILDLVKGINANDLVIGAAGAGKTRGYVIPNLFYGDCSKIVADTKRDLYKKYGTSLKEKGFNVELIDFVDPEKSTLGYNPLLFVRKDKIDSDIKRIAEAICPLRTDCHDIFWPQQGQMYLEFAISYVLEMLLEKYHTLESVEETIDFIGTDILKKDVSTLRKNKPGCLAERTYSKILKNIPADKMHASILGVTNNALNRVIDDQITQLYSMKRMISFEKFTKRKTVLFLNLSDADKTRETLVNLFYTQALQELIRIADESKGSRLAIPVRIIFDDFASNVLIPDFDKIISVIRSRNISVSVILQSLTQLFSMYGESAAMTIIDNCDTQIFLGGQNVKTAEYFGVKMDKLAKSLLSMPLEKECVFIRGQEPRIVDKYDLSIHEQELTGVKESKDVMIM